MVATKLLLNILFLSYVLTFSENDSRFKSLQDCLRRCAIRASNIQAMHVCFARHAHELRAENDNLRSSYPTDFDASKSKDSAAAASMQMDTENILLPKSAMFRAALSVQKLRGGTQEKAASVETGEIADASGSYDYDYFVIGGGSGGVRSARIAASHGARVALAEAATGGDSADG